MIIGSNLLFFENLPSTNDHITRLLKNSYLPEGTIVYTNFQEAGRGYSGNRWESEDGKNLLISILLFPSFIEPINQFCLSMAVSLGICDFLTRFIADCFVKWPNDIYVNNDKIAGILIENSVIQTKIEHTIAGIGLNINQEKFSDYSPNPVSLSILTGKNYNLTSCLNQLASDLDKRYKQLIAGDLEQLQMEYEAKLYRMNKWNSFKDIGGIFTGRIISVGEYGRLIIERKNRTISDYAFKEVEFIL